MAFVIRSERKIIIMTSDKDIPGPGQYIRMPFMNMTTTQSKAPFNSSFIKEKYAKEPSPGPGSYNVSLSQSKSGQDVIKAFNINTNASSVDLNSTNQILVKNNNEKLGFLTKVGRFNKHEAINKALVPDLHMLLKPKEKQQNRKGHKTAMITSFMALSKGNNSLPGSIKRIVSIPSKEMRGYVLEKNGEALMILDSILNEDKAEGKNSPCDNPKESLSSSIGPGSYDIKFKWKNNALDWKKTRKTKANCNTVDNNCQKSPEETIDSYIKEFKRQGDFVPHLPRIKSLEDKKLLYNSIHLRKKMNPLIIEKERRMSYMTDTLSPGPGYYTREIISDAFGNQTDYSNHSPQVKYGNFATTFRDGIKKTNRNDETGPGSYFQSKNKYDKDKKYYHGLQYKSLYQVNEAIIAKNRKLKCSNSFAGPGSYELLHGFITGMQSNKEPLNSGPERFGPLLKVEKRPGPGEYLDQNIISKAIKAKSNMQSVLRLNDSNGNRGNDRLSIKSSSNFPPVGLYDSDVYGTIRHENELRNNKFQSNIAPFLNTTNRFEIRIKSSPIGPGAYLKDSNGLKNEAKTTKNACFNNKEKRFKLFDKGDNHKGGPSDYDLSSSLKWNKRSFNVLFFKPKS